MSEGRRGKSPRRQSQRGRSSPSPIAGALADARCAGSAEIDSALIHVVVPADHAGGRIDTVLSELASQSRSRVQAWIRSGLVRHNGGTVERASEQVEPADTLSFPEPSTSNSELIAENEPIVVLHEDEHLIVVDKPAGLIVHPGAGRRTGTLCHRLLYRYPEIAAIGSIARPGIVHRLDQGTSGLMVIARSEIAYSSLTSQFERRRVDKRYWAMIRGRAGAGRLVLDEPIGRNMTDRIKMTTRPDGRPAHTEVRRLGLAANETVSLVEVKLLTGRTHQIRVHLSERGFPLIGDSAYPGNGRMTPPLAALDFARPALHAIALGVRHPISGSHLEFLAPIPTDMNQLWRDLDGTPENLATLLSAYRPTEQPIGI